MRVKIRTFKIEAAAGGWMKILARKLHAESTLQNFDAYMRDATIFKPK